jgi:hypothetical protein
VSLLLRDECRIVLRPDCVVLARLRRELAHLGLKRHMLAKQVVPCNVPGDEKTPWGGALKALEAVMPGFADSKSYATVVLSNHFMRYALVPWSDALDDETEEVAYARHSFNEMYGSDASNWELRISQGKAGIPQLACAVDARLPESLRDLFGRVGIGLKSIQPHLMVAYNACHASLHDKSAWLALVEEGNLCLALLQKGKWSWVRSMRIGPHWHKELPFLLNREALVSDIESSTNEVFLWAPDCRDVSIASGGRWQIQPVQPARMPSIEPVLDSRFSMYMSG